VRAVRTGKSRHQPFYLGTTLVEVEAA